MSKTKKTILDRFAEEQLDRFEQALDADSLKDLGQQRDLLDQPLQRVAQFKGLTKRRIRVMKCHVSSVDQEVSIILGTLSNEVRRIVLEPEREHDTHIEVDEKNWLQKGLPGRVLSICIMPTPTGDRIFAGLETGECIVLDYETGKILRETKLGGNLIDVSIVPEGLIPQGHENRYVVFCTHNREQIYIVDANGELVACNDRAFLNTGAPRACFFAKFPKQTTNSLTEPARKETLCVMTDNAVLVFLKLNFENNKVEIQEDFEIDEGLAPNFANPTTFDCEWISDYHEHDVALAVTSQAPTVAGVFSYKEPHRPEMQFSHYSNELCYFCEAVAGTNLIFFGSRNGNIFAYTKCGISVSVTKVNGPARAAAKFPSGTTYNGLCVAHDSGDLSVFWIPPVRSKGGLLEKLNSRLNQEEYQSYLQSSPSIAVLQWIAIEKFKHMDEYLPQSLNWSVPEESFPGFMGTIELWLDRKVRDQRSVRLLLEQWIPEQKVPASLATFSDERRIRIMGGLGGTRTRFDEISKNLQSNTKVLSEEHLNRVGRAMKDWKLGNRESCAEALAYCLKNVPDAGTCHLLFDQIARVPQYCAVEGIVNGIEDAKIVAALLTDGTVHQLKVMEGFSADEFDASNHIVVTPLQLDGRPTRLESICVTEKFTACASLSGLVEVVDNDSGDITEFRKTSRSKVTSLTVWNGNLFVGTVSGTLEKISLREEHEEQRIIQVRTSDKESPVICLSIGRFLSQNRKDLVFFQEEKGAFLMTEVEGKYIEKQISTDSDCPSQLLITDVDGDGLDDFCCLDQYQSELTYYSSSDDTYFIEEGSRSPSDVKAIGLLKLGLADGSQRIQTVVGSNTGEAYRLGISGQSKVKAIPLNLRQIPDESGTEDHSVPITGIGWLPSPLGELLLIASQRYIDIYRPWSLVELKQTLADCGKSFSSPQLSAIKVDLQDQNLVRSSKTLQRAFTQLQQNLFQHTNDLLLVRGIAGSGKSAVISTLKATLQDNRFKYCEVEVDETNTSLSDLYLKMVAAIRSIYPFGIDSATLNSVRKNKNPSQGAIETLLMRLKGWLKKEKDPPILITILSKKSVDAPLANGVSPLYRELIKLLSKWSVELGPEICFLLSDHKCDQENLEIENIAIRSVELPAHLSDEETDAVFSVLLPKEIEMTEPAIQELRFLSDCRVELIRECCRYILEDITTRSSLLFTASDIRQIGKKIDKSSYQLYHIIWSQLSGMSRLALGLAAYLQRWLDQYSASDFAERSILAERILTSQELTEQWKTLAKHGVINEVQNGKYCLPAQRFAAWIRTGDRSFYAQVMEAILNRSAQIREQSHVPLKQIEKLDNELTESRQKETVLQFLKIELFAWNDLVQLSRLFSELSSRPSENHSSSPRNSQLFLHAFVRWTQCRLDHDSPHELGCHLGVGYLPTQMTTNDQPVSFLVIPEDSFRNRLNRTNLNQLVTHAVDFSMRFLQERPLQFVLLIFCAPRSKEIEDLVKGLPSHTLTIAIFEEEIRATVVASEPMKTFRRLLTHQTSAKSALNPYQSQGCVQFEQMIMPRQATNAPGQTDLAEEIVETWQNYKIVGSRRIGKTTLLRRIYLSLQNAPNHFVVSVNMETLIISEPENIEEDAWRILAQGFADEEQQFKNADFPLEAPINSEAEYRRLHQKLRQSGKKLTILIDECDIVIVHKGAGSFLVTLRAISQTSAESLIRLVMTGWKEFQDACWDKHSPLFNFGPILELNQLNEIAAEKLIIEVMKENDREYKYPTIPKNIQKVASRHPAFLQTFLRQLFYKAGSQDYLSPTNLLPLGRKNTAKAGSQPLLIHPEHVTEVAASNAFMSELRATIKVNFSDFSLLAYGTLLRFTLEHKNTRRINVHTLREEMEQNLIENSLNEGIPDDEFQSSVSLLVRATAAREESDSHGERYLVHTFPDAFKVKDANSLIEEAYKQIIVKIFE